MARSFKRPDEAAMQRVFARTSGGAAEVVLRLAWLQGLHRAEITALRWDQVDFAGRGTGARGRAVLPCGRGDAAGGAVGCDPNVSAGTRQRPPSGFSQAAECFPGTGDADPAAAGGAGGADSHGAALHAAKREIAGYDCWNY